MEYTFTITEQEYVNANLLFTKPTKKIKAIYLVSVILLLIFFAISEALNQKIIIIGALIGGYVGQYLVKHVYAPWQTRKQYRVYKSAQEPITVVYLEDGIRFKSKIGESELDWSRINSWRENKDFILIYQAPRVYHIIPKRIGNVASKIKDSLIQHVRKST